MDASCGSDSPFETPRIERAGGSLIRVSALDRLSTDAPLRIAAELLMKPEAEARRDVWKVLQPYTRPMWEAPVAIEEETVLAVLEAVFELTFPPPANAWDDGPGQLVFALLGNVTPAVLERIEARYGDGDPRLPLNLLTLVLSSPTRAAATTAVRIVQRHGWPASFHQRFVRELGGHTANADVLYPALLEVPGGPEVDLVEGLLKALRGGTFEVSRLKNTVLERSLAERLKALRAQARGDDDRASEARGVYAALLELAGFVGGAEVVAELRESLGDANPWPIVFGSVSLVRRGEPMAPEVFATVGAVDRVRVALYELLAQLGERERLPLSARSREAFAASDVTRWLAHPNELGCPPAALELMARLEVPHEGRPAEVFLWRFLDGRKPDWLAATSGPYLLDAPEGPLSGPLTFSKFERWDSRDALGHLGSIRTTLEEWSARR